MDSIDLVCAWLDIPPPGDDNNNERHRRHPHRHHHHHASRPVTSPAEDSFHHRQPFPHQLVNPPPDAGSQTPVDSHCFSRLDIVIPAVTTVASDRGVPVLVAGHRTACPPRPLNPPPSPANVHTYATNLTSIPSILPRKRNRTTSINAVVSSTWTIPTPEQVRAKRRALECLVRAANFGLPPASLQTPAFAPHVLAVLRRFAPSEFERGCLPFTPEVASVLDVSFPHEVFSSRARVENLSVNDRPRARTLLDFAIRVHLACVRNYAKGLDEAAWYPSVRSLLSINPSSPSPSPSRSSSCIPDPPLPEPHVPSPEELFVTIDATMKTTRTAIPPGHPNVKLDYLLAFNPEHVDCVSTAATLRQRNLLGNAFNDVSLEESIVILGVEVKTPGGTQSELGAEYHQVGVWAAKTLELARAMLEEPAPLTAACDLAISLTVYGHAWSIHLTYWLTPTLQITHGPVMVGSTDTLYGTLKIIRFITEFKQWARSTVLGDWKARITSATMG